MKWIYTLVVAAGLSMPAAAQYAGPAILTRGEAPTAMSEPQVNFRPFATIGYLYDTGLAGVTVDSQGKLSGSASSGLELSWGVSGTNSWKHTKVQLEYVGSLYHYSQSTFHDGVDQSLMLGVTRQLSRHTALTLRQTGGLFSRNYGVLGLPETVQFDPASSYIPTTDFYDNRTFHISTQADYSVQKSTRLSFSFGGNGFLARRRSSALFGVTGSGARADAQYRVTGRSTIGVGYTYSHYDYHGILSNTDLHGFVGSYAIRFTRNLELTGFGGAMRAETKFQQNVPVDPAIAALIGTRVASMVNYRVDYVPNISARLSRAFSRGVAYLSGGHTVTPGNGLFLTSTDTNASLGYTYTGFRRWSVNGQAAYDRAKSLSNFIGYYGNVGGSLTASRQIAPSLHAIASFQVRRYAGPDFSQYNRTMYTLRLSLGFTPGDLPLRLW